MFCRPRRGTACERHTRCAGASPLAPFPPQRVEVPWTGAGGREIQEEEAEQYRGLTFPTSGGSECEYHDQGLIGSVADFVEQGRAKFFCVNTNTSDSFHNKSAHPLHRSWMQRMYDEYLVAEVVPFVHHHCRGWQPIATLGASLGAYYAVNALLKHPEVFKRCFGLSGVYDMKSFMDGLYDDNFYFNNPVDYVPNLSDPWYYQQLQSC